MRAACLAGAVVLWASSCATTRPAAPPPAPRDEKARDAELAEAAKLYVEIDQHFEKGEYLVALPLAERCLKLREKWLAPKDLVLADTLDSMGLALELAGHPREARPYYEKVLATRVEKLGEDHDDTEAALTRLGILLFTLSDPNAALPLLQRAKAIAEKLHGADSKQVASALNAIGAAQWSQGDLAGARASLEASLARSADGGRSRTATLDNLGQVLVEQGELSRARQIVEGSLAAREKLYGPDHPDVAYALNTLGSLLEDVGELATAQAMLERALAIREKALGPSHPLVATSLLNLGRVRWAQGDLAAARELFTRALAIDEQVHGAQSPTLAATLANQAGLEERVGNLTAAAALYRRALSTVEKTQGPEGRETLWVSVLSSATELRLGHRAEAKARLAHAVAGAEKAGARGALLTEALVQHGALLFQDGQREEGVQQVTRAVELLSKSLPADAPTLARARAQLAMYQGALGHSEQARALLEQALGSIGRWLDRSVVNVSQHQESEFLGGFQEYLSDALAQGWSPEDTWRQVLRFQGGAALAASARRLETWSKEDRAPAVEKQLHDLAEVRAAIARLQRAAGPKQQRELAQLVDREAALAASLTRDSSGYREQAAQLAAGPDEVCGRLPRDAALVDFVAFWPAQLGPEPVAGRLAAFVVRREAQGCSVRRVDLKVGTDEALRLVVSWRAAGESDAVGLAHRRGEQLRAAVVDPLAPLLDRPLVYVVPDGPLAGVSFGALPEAGSTVGEQRYLLERLAFSYLGSAKDLLRSPPEAPGGARPPLVLGGLDFGPAPAAAASPTGQRGGSEACEVGGFSDLEGARQEAAAVARRLGKGAVLLSGAAGTERALREQAAHRSVLHIATHGFFLGQCQKDARERGAELDPMQLSGLALAGASAHQGRPPEDDGLFTAADFATLDLRGTRLVVLSACDTGVGGIISGQGVQGLQQAVLTAGVPSLVMSLWKIPDEDTRALMDAFYGGVGAGLAPREALRRAQLEALARQRAQGRGDAIGRLAAFIHAGI